MGIEGLVIKRRDPAVSGWSVEALDQLKHRKHHAMHREL
jgi:hypothetical protein